MKFPRRRHGFTLIEILIVVCILGLLAAILFPVFARVREAGRRTTCSSNLHQLGLAFKLYVADSAGRYPPFIRYGEGHRCAWADRLCPSYVKSPGIFYCPSHPAENQLLSQCGGSDEVEVFKYGGSYDAVSYFSLPEVRLRHPDGTVLVMDGVGGEVNSTINLHQTMQELRANDSIQAWHSGGNNHLFTDGHVKWMPLDVIYNPDYWRP